MNEALPRTGVVVPDLDWSATDLDQRLTGRGGVEFSGNLVLRGEPVGTFECRGDGYPLDVRIRDEGHRSEWGRWVDALAAKFAPGTPLAAWLLGTLPYAIAEGNTWGDRFWGQVREDGAWVGENWLGVLLMARRAELVALDAMPSVRVGGHRFDDLMVLAEALGVAEEPSLMPGCLEVDPPVEIEDEGPAPCTNALCSWPSSRCRIDEEFAGVVDAEGFYDPGDTDTCASMVAEQADG